MFTGLNFGCVDFRGLWISKKNTPWEFEFELREAAYTVHVVWCSIQVHEWSYPFREKKKKVVDCADLCVELVRFLFLCDLPKGLWS